MMRLAHLADLHLGFRRYYRENADGVNVREADVALAFQRAVTDVIAQAPDVVLIAGDVFHRVRPPNGAILLFEEQLARLRDGLRQAELVMIAGDHDTPREFESKFILPVARRFGVHVACGEPLVVPVAAGTVTAVPNAALAQMPAPPDAPGHHVLLSHGDIAGYGAPAPERGLDPDALEGAGWAYVALGHYHVSCQVRPRVWYAGSLEYTSTDAWGELRKESALGLPGKGYLLVELGSTVGPLPLVQFRPIGPARRHLDLDPIDAAGMAVADIDAALAARLGALELDGACVRLVVRDIPRDYKRALNYGPIRQWKARALDLQLDLRRPEADATPAARARVHRRLDDFVETMLGERPLPPDMDRTTFVAKGLEYLKAAAAADDSYT